MSDKRSTVILGSGSYLPENIVRNADFISHQFYGPDGQVLRKDNNDIIQQFEQITGIQERRYVSDDLHTSDIAYFAAREALSSSGIDGETLDYIIVAHNFGDARKNTPGSDLVPTLAARVKYHLGIRNPRTVAYDLPFGCAGWLQGVIQAHYYIRSGDASKVLVIGAETLSRVTDPHDRDSMIYADGAGAVIVGADANDENTGILAHSTRSDTEGLAYLLQMGGSSNPELPGKSLFLKMQGRKLYENALKLVPQAMKECLDKAGLDIKDVGKVLIHQANNKMDEAILRELFLLYGLNEIPAGLMPMTISWLGNSSVATVPTLYDLIMKGKFDGHDLRPGSIVLFAAVGAGINVNAVAYRVPGR